MFQTLGQVIQGSNINPTIKALVILLADTPLYNQNYPFVLINGTIFPSMSLYLNYTPVSKIKFSIRYESYFQNVLDFHNFWQKYCDNFYSFF